VDPLLPHLEFTSGTVQIYLPLSHTSVKPLAIYFTIAPPKRTRNVHELTQYWSDDQKMGVVVILAFGDSTWPGKNPTGNEKLLPDRVTG